jgi:hypothetical protein
MHRRFGKTVFSINEMIDRGLRNKLRNPRYAYVAPTYGQAKRVAWDIIKDSARNIPGCTINESELRIDIDRGEQGVLRFTLLGAENPGSIRGIYLDGVILDEYAECDPTIWSTVIRPALADRLGWAIFIGTPKGNNHFQKIYRVARKFMREGHADWFSAMYKSSETGILPLSELEAARATMTQPEYDQEFECSFEAALTGAYYADQFVFLEKENRFTGVPWVSDINVMTGWDLGIDDSTAIWFIQKVGRELRVIDYLEVSGKSLIWIVGELDKKPYNYGTHFLPHDAQHRELGTGKTRIETLKNLGLKRIEVAKKLNVADGINAVRGMFSQLWFDKDKCDYGIECLRNYERKFDAKEGVFRSVPRHNWASHGSDAMRTFAVGFRGDDVDVDTRYLPTQGETEYDIFGSI